ncbi:hypothetical protein DPMN_181366 [Dreissena polymorpha]|uniref:Uncharacterized protein n=1 Tax=Dreissena polymorpha TaxID=45954 RepID=A0A9D4I4B7_DREPO|nr:hypothetical protein DPMN_181366 [Dreissena polymorpha]
MIRSNTYENHNRNICNSHSIIFISSSGSFNRTIMIIKVISVIINHTIIDFTCF